MSELQRAGTKVVAICKPHSNVEKYLSKHGISFSYLPSYSKISFKSPRSLRSFCEEHNVDVVHVHYHKDIWCSSLALRGDRQRKLFLGIYMGVTSKNDILHRWIYKRVDALLTSSQELHSRLHELYPVPKEKIYFFPYGRLLEGYEINQVKRAAIRAQLNVQSDEMLVGTMVRIDPGKGAMDFAESFLYLEQELQKKVRFLIVGEPTRKGNVIHGGSPFELRSEEYFRQLKKFISEHQLEHRIHLVGFQEDVVGYLGAMDVFVFPSRDEMYSLVVLDAMAMGLPIVAAGAGGNLLQITDNQNGLLYEVSNSKDMAKKITRYIESPDLRKQHGSSARLFVEERHDMKKTIAQLMNLYKST